MPPRFYSRSSRLALSLWAACWAQAAAAEPVSAPQWKVRDRWVYELNVNPADTCTKNHKSGAQQVVEVKAADAGGYQLLRTADGREVKQNVEADFTTLTKVGFADAKGDSFGFPIHRAKPWPSASITTAGFGTIKTAYSCGHRPADKVGVPAGEYEAIPIVCEGTWASISFRSGDKAIAKYW